MDYVKILDDLEFPKRRWFLRNLDFEGEWDFWKYLVAGTVPIPDRILNITFRQKGTPIDFTFADFSLPIVNDKVKDLVGENNAQFLPVKVEGREEPHYLMVINNEIECVDEPRSVFDKYVLNDPIRPDLAGEYKTIYKLAITNKVIPDQINIFRLKKYEVVILISEELKDKFVKNKITGIKFENIIQ